ncbi:HxlR family transcriptional regulator [Actinocorallia herbida]|uniref:HxlR family transcriptional regulator n=1 Tax=Actinocorallia herbida TaxID=58109 RepID=A0A3N1D9T1_9ACTN|nr:helix-turn-helix domain-containing protein [Actinocorallia herbida]ROO90287.1 HxlR family transcriptional regulator [Actinocorallia herbida]
MTTLSAAARRAAARADHLDRAAACPANRLLDRLGDKWAPLVLRALADGPLRYNALSRTVAGASQKMLTQTLRALERDGFLRRTAAPGVPARVDYALTPLAESLLPLLDSLASWAEENMPRVDRSRAAYDTRRG